MAAVWAQYKLSVDWDNDGLYANANSDISAFIKGDIDIVRGRSSFSPLTGRTSPMAFSVTVDNSTRLFSSSYTSGALSGKIKPWRAFKITMKIGTGAEVTIAAGRLKKVTDTPGTTRAKSVATITGQGVMAQWARRYKVNIPMLDAVTPGTALGQIAASIGFLDSLCTFDEGKSTLVRYWTGGEKSAMQAARDIEDDEAGFLVEGMAGDIRFEDRSHRFLSPHTVSQATYTNSTAGSIRYSEIQPVDTDDEIFNIVEAKVRTFNLSEDKLLWNLVDVWTEGNTGDAIEIADGDTISLEALYPTKDSGTSEISVSSWTLVTYEANTLADGSGTDVTADVIPVDAEGVEILEANGNTEYGKFDNKRVLNFKNNSGATAYIIVLKCDGIAVVEGAGVQVSARDETSITDYDECPYTFPGKFITSRAEGQAFCDYFVDMYKQPLKAVWITLEANANAAHLLEAQTRDISDRITIVDVDGISADYFVEQRKDKIKQNGIHTVSFLCSKVPSASTWAASAITYTPKEIPDSKNEVPDQLIWTNALPLINSVIFFCGAEKWNATISEAEFRAKRVDVGTTVLSVDLRTVDEGGTFAHNGLDQIIVTGLFADYRGFRYQLFYGAYPGTWYWAIRLKNDQGWSNWSDGNLTPQYVRDFIDTTETSAFDIGPPKTWDLTIRNGVQPGTAVLAATRPTVNGNRIMSIRFQIRDTTSGFWRNVDAIEGAADTLYDGSEIDHTYNPLTGILSKLSGTFGDAATDGGLLLIDVRQNNFDHRCTVWQEIQPSQISDNQISGVQSFGTDFDLNVNGEYAKLRIKIVKPPQSWNNAEPAANIDGFLAGAGFAYKGFVSDEAVGDLDTDEFVSPPFTIPTGLTLGDIGGRVWFENTYSVSDDENHTVAIVDAAQSVKIPVLIHVTAEGAPPAEGRIAMIRIPCNIYIEGVSILADATGDIQFDVRVCTYNDYPDDSADSIVAAAAPLLSGAAKYADATLTGWTRNLAMNDCLVFYVEAGAATLTKATITLSCTRRATVGSGSGTGSDVLPTPWAYWPMDEISTFDIVGGPSIWWYGTGPSGRGRYVYVKHSYQIAGDVESLLNGDAYGPIYIPPNKAIVGYWKSASRTIGIGPWVGGGAGTHFFDDSYALANVKVIGYKIWTNSVDGGPIGIKGWQAIYRDSAGATVYGPIRGTTSGETENQFLMADGEYITGIKGYYGWSDQSAFKQKIIQLEFVTNLGSYKYGSAYDTPFTINVPAGTSGMSYTFAGLHGAYAGDPRAMRVVGILYYVDTYHSADLVPDDVTEWNLYTSADGVTYTKLNTTPVALTAAFQEAP